MTKRSNKLLRTACEKIQELAEPAYIKDSSLRIFCANHAFSNLLGFEPEDIVGIKPENLALDFDFTDWSERERHTFIFGEDQSATFVNGHTDVIYLVEMERFITDDEKIFVFGRFIDSGEAVVQEQVDSLQQIADIGRQAERVITRHSGAATDNKSGSPQSDHPHGDIANLLLEGINGLDAGILLYDAAGILQYVNAKFFDMDPIYRGVIQVGMHIEQIISTVHDVLLTYDPEMPADQKAAARAEWIAGRLANHRQPFHEIIWDMGGGRWVRVMNRCLQSGVVISLRIDISEQKALELHLQNQMNAVKIYQAVLEDLPVAAYVRDHDLKLLFGNAAYVDLLGKRLSDMLGKTPAAILGTRNPLPVAYNAAAMETGQLQVAEFEYERANGDVVAAYARSQRITTGDGKAFVIGSITDVTGIRERERQLIMAENQARQLREDLENIVDLLPLGLLVLDKDMKIELVNQRFCDFVEIQSKSDLLGMHFLDYLHYGVGKFMPNLPPEAAEKAIDRWFETTKTGTKGSIELTLGADQILTYTATPFGDGRIVLTYSNITEARKREIEINETRKALEQTGAILREASSVMEQGLIVFEDDTIIYVNKAYRDILNLPADYILADQNFESALRTLMSRGEFENASAVPNIKYQNFMNAFQDRQYYDSVVYLEKLCRWVKVEIIPAGDNRVVVVFNNVTELKLRERELEKMLIRAEVADRAKSEFLANMSHEIRTPMNGVLAMTGLLASTEMDTRQKTFLDVAMKSGKTLLTIINDVLDFSKMDGGQLELKHVVFSPAEAIEDVAMLMASRASERKLDFIVGIDPSVPGLVRSDAGRFRQVVTNLVSNAIKFTDSGHVGIHLTAEIGPDKSCELMISIDDTGMGISEEKLATIEQAISSDGTNKDLYPKGAGLGLPITIGLIRLFKGALEFKTDPASGTRAIVRLPMQVESSSVRALITPAHMRGRRLLVIDDYDISCQHISKLVEGFGFDVAGARSGDEGLEICKLAHSAGLPVDVVLIDSALDWMGGIDIARAIRANSVFQLVDIILLADLDQIADDGVLNSLNIGAVVAKPVRRGLLHESIVNVLDARQSGPQSSDLLSLGVNRPSSNVLEKHGSMEPAANPESPSSDDISILVAEDNEINKIVFSQVLSALNVSHRIVSNGGEAVEAWKNMAPSLIFMDIDMPVMDGYAATLAIRDLEAGRASRVTIIGVTPHADAQIFASCLDSGMDDCMSKPLSPERLGAMIAKWTRSTEDRQSASR